MWQYDKTSGVWKCSSYSDLNYAEINNFAEYGQPWSPYEPGFLQDHDPDFGKIVIEMPQVEVMTMGYGKNITVNSFEIANVFLRSVTNRFPSGTYTFEDLVRQRFAKPGDRWIRSNLYGWGSYGVSAGAIDPLDAAYIHGTISFALMKDTRFTVDGDWRIVDAETGAGDDNWDFESSSISDVLNAAVGTVFGPDHYNLTAPIQIRYRGKGKRSRDRTSL